MTSFTSVNIKLDKKKKVITETQLNICTATNLQVHFRIQKQLS